MFELREKLEHLLLDDLNILVQKFLDRVGAEVEEHGELLDSIDICRLVDMYDIGEYFSKTAVDVVVKFPFDLTEEISVEDQLVNIDQQLLADTFEKTFQRVLQIVFPAEGFLHEALDEVLHSMEFSLQVSSVELGVSGCMDL